MDLLNLLAVLIFSSSKSLGESSSEYLNFGIDNLNKEDAKNNNFIPNLKELSRLGQGLFIKFPTLDSSTDSPLENVQENKEKDEENEPDISFSPDLQENLLPESLLLNEGTAEKNLLNRFFKEGPYEFEEDYWNEELKPNPTPMRRQVNNWGASPELFYSNNIPWNLDTSSLKTSSPQGQTEYLDDSYPMDVDQRNTSFLEEAEVSYQVEPSQLYQKNYYYNYYPLVRRHYDQKKTRGQKLDEMSDFKGNKRNDKFFGKKIERKNPCKLYLQFLKYAFEELDKNSDHYYDSADEEYIDDWRDSQADINHRMLATHSLGPTLYVDNSGRVFQVNSKGNSIQTVEGLSFSSKVPGLEKDLAKPGSTQNYSKEDKTEASTKQPLYNPFIITYGGPSIELNVNTESSSMNEKETQTVNPDIKEITEDSYPTTISLGGEKTATVTESTFLLTTVSPSKPDMEEYYGRSGLNFMNPDEMFNKSNSSVGTPLYFPKQNSMPDPTVLSVFPDKNEFRAETMISFEKSNEPRKKEVDCNDKMLPCPDTVNITYPLNGYCNRFVSCESGVAIRRTCENGFHFNIITKSCDFPHNSICSYYCPEPNGYYGIPGDCGGYFICKNSIPEYRMCPPRMHWDVRISSCTFAALSSCPMKCSKLNEVKSYLGDCKAYVICLNGIPYYHKCPPNMIYNSESQTCVPASQFYCKDDSRLMTKTSNPSTLCRNIDQKLGTKSWCSYYISSENK